MTFLETLHSLGFFSPPHPPWDFVPCLLRGDLDQIHHLRGESGTLGAERMGEQGRGAAFPAGEPPWTNSTMGRASPTTPTRQLWLLPFVRCLERAGTHTHTHT